MVKSAWLVLASPTGISPLWTWKFIFCLSVLWSIWNVFYLLPLRNCNFFASVASNNLITSTICMQKKLLPCYYSLQMRKSHAPPPPSSDIEISNVTNWQELATSQRCSFYGIPYIYSTENKWLQIISDYVKMSFVDHGGDLKSRYKLIAILSSGEVQI